MKLNELKLLLLFDDEDIEVTAPEIIPDWIVKGSVRFHYQILDGLMSSSNQVALQLTRDCPSIADIIGTDKDIHATLKEGEVILFSGYLSTNHSWSVTQHGEKSFNITIESVGTRLLSRPFIQSGYHLFDCAADSAIRAICNAVGITISPSMPVLTERVLKVVEASQTCRDILSKLVYELGYVYVFDNLGRLDLFRIDCTSVSGVRTLDGDNLVCTSNKAVGLSRSIRQYDSSRVSFQETARASDYLVYRNTTGQDSTHPFCNLEIPAGGHFDGSEVYTSEQWTQELVDEFREPALIEACNATSETEIVGSNDILAVSNIRCVCEKGRGIEASITAAGGPYLSIDAHNDGDVASSVTHLDAFGDIIYQKSTGIVRSGSEGNVLSEELQFVHERSLAQRHANLLSDYYRHCSSKYSFYLREDIALGSIVRLNDNVFSGLDVNVLLVSKDLTDTSDVVAYTAIGISVFNLNRSSFHRSTGKGMVDAMARSTRWITGTVLQGGPLARGVLGNEGDQYLNSETGDIYRCISSGNSVSALWERTGNIRGPQGDAITVAVEVEYSLSSSRDHYRWPFVEIGDDQDSFGFEGGTFGTEDAIWDDESYRTLWHRGLYVWQRIRATDENGNIIYEEPSYNEDITQGLYASCVFEIVPDSPTWDKNNADKGDTTVRFHIVTTGFVTESEAAESISALFFNAYKDAVKVASFSINEPNTLTPVFSFPTASDWDYLEIEGLLRFSVDDVIVQEQTARTSMSANDITRLQVFGGTHADDGAAATWFTNHCGGILDGYSYVNSSDNCIRIVRGGQWVPFNLIEDQAEAGQVLNQAEKSLWDLYDSMSYEQKLVAWELYGYKDRIVARAMATARLTMYGEGVIASSGVPVNPEDGTTDGFLDNIGYRLEGQNGILRASGCYVKDGHFQDGTFSNIVVDQSSKLYGEVVSEVFETCLVPENGTRCIAASPDPDSGAADGVLGSEVKANLVSWLSSILGDSHQVTPGSTNIDKFVLSDVSLGGFSGASAVMRFASVSNTIANLAVLESEQPYSTTDRSLEWVNPYPTDIIVRVSTVCKSVSWSREDRSLTWVRTSDGWAVDDQEPEETQRPRNPSEGQKWSEISNKTSHNGTWKFHYVVWEAHWTTTADEGIHRGSVSMALDGRTIANSGRFSVPAGGRLSFVFYGVDLDSGEFEDDSEDGSATISWIESESFKTGVLLVKDASRESSKYISDLPDGVWITSPSLRLTEAGVYFHLPLNSASEWDENRYQVSHGAIHKLFLFRWNSKTNGTFSSFSSRIAATATLKDGSTSYAIGSMTSIMSATVGNESLTATWKGRYNSTGTFVLKGTEYYRSYSVDFTPIARAEGVKSKSLTPFEDNTHTLGTESYRWKSLHAVKIYADGTELTSSKQSKEDISDYVNDALKLVNNTKIVSFRYKRDHGDEKAHRYIGFIAEDTDEALSTPAHDRMDVGSCIGVLIKAVQELSDEVERLKGGDYG